MYVRTKGGFLPMDIKNRIYQLMELRGWTTYMLAEKAGMTQSTISTMFRSTSVPTIPTLEKICEAFGISLADFFSDEQDSEGEVLLIKINSLPERRKELTKAIIDEFNEK